MANEVQSVNTYDSCVQERRAWENAGGYEKLPGTVISRILLKMTLVDRSRAALTCKSWFDAFQAPECWKSFRFRFYSRKDTRFLQLFRSIVIHHLQNVCIEFNQLHNVNRLNALEALRCIRDLGLTQLHSLQVVCTGENPLFYAGKEFVTALEELFERCNSLRRVDLRRFPMMFDNHTIEVLSVTNPQLQYLDIQSDSLVCMVDPQSLLNLVERCRNLRYLSVQKCSLSENVLLAFTKGYRAPLQYLSIKCRSEENTMNADNREHLSSEVWDEVTTALPDLRVQLIFDQTCPLNAIPIVMKPEVPCVDLRLETFAIIHDRVLFAALCYNDTLEKLVVHCPPSPELEDALLVLSDRCHLLHAIHVFCPISQEVIETILRQHPAMSQRGTFTLKWEAGTDGPWATDDSVDA